MQEGVLELVPMQVFPVEDLVAPMLVLVLPWVLVSPEVPKLVVASEEMQEGVTKPILELMPMQVFPVEDLVVLMLVLVLPWVLVSPEVPKLVVESKEMQEGVLELVPM
jgi:hypothetical protein